MFCCLERKFTLALFVYLSGWLGIFLLFMIFTTFTLVNWDVQILSKNLFSWIISFLDIFFLLLMVIRFYTLYEEETSLEKDCKFQFQAIDGILLCIGIGLSVLFFCFFNPPLWDLPLFYYLIFLHGGSLTFLFLLIVYTGFENCTRQANRFEEFNTI